MPEAHPSHFTVAQANQAVKIIRPLMAEIQSIREQILAQQAEIWPAVERSAGNGGNPTLSRMVHDFERLDDLVHAIHRTGALLKDLNTGLVDFPALRGDQEVYLCWKHGEPGVLFWHEIEAGFAGRRPIRDF